MMKLLRSLKTSKSGASAAEYALIVAVMGGLVVAGALAFGGSLNTTLDTTGAALEGNATKNATKINQ
jgi:pilus assembly protein Flp/PilA